MYVSTDCIGSCKFESIVLDDFDPTYVSTDCVGHGDLRMSLMIAWVMVAADT